MQILEKIFRMFFLPVSFLEFKLFLVDLKITQRYQSLCSLLGQNTPQMHLLEGRSCPCLMCHRHDGRSRQGEDKTSVTPHAIYSAQDPSSWNHMAHILGGSSQEAPHRYPQSTVSKSSQVDKDNGYTCRKSYRKDFK